MKREIDFSVVIPAFNESQRIIKTLEEVYSYFKEKKITVEVIVVDDGSRDGTASLVKGYLEKHFLNYRILQNAVNCGKGFSVKKGMLHCRGNYALFMDADHSTRIGELEKFLPFVREGADVLIGSRYSDSSSIGLRQPWTRRMFGRVSNWLIQKTLLPGFEDTQCGFKVFSKNACGKIFPMQKISGWGFDFEILTIARTLGITIREVPVDWSHAPGGSMKWSRAISALLELARVKINALRNVYR